MDRFKYRGWHKEKKKMYDIESICPYEDEHTLGGEVFIKGFKNSLYFPEEVILMQCTGLKDHTGKLIFESDIVEVRYNGGQIPLFNRKYTNEPEPERFFIRYSDEWQTYFCNNAIQDMSWLNPPLDYLNKTFERQLYPDDADVNNRVTLGKAILVNDYNKFCKVIGNIYETPELLVGVEP